MTEATEKIITAMNSVDRQYNKCIITLDSAYQQIKGIIKAAEEFLTAEEFESMGHEFQRRLDMYYVRDWTI